MTARLQSLDVFRGLTIALMILVNTPGSWDYVYAPFRHADWNGLTPTDLVFPFFLFIMGVSISFSMSPVAKTGLTAPFLFKIFKRTAILFLIGLFLNVIPDFKFSSIRIPGVLQRIALVFMVNAILFATTTRKTQIIIGLVILISYWVLLTFVPFNGQVPQYLTPDNNLAAYVDSILLKGHMWSVTNTWDPEGLLSTLPAIVSTLIGMIVGAYLKKYDYRPRKVSKIFIVGIVLIIAGLLFHPFFPINKSLWTSTYVLVSSGAATLFFVVLHLFIDVKQIMPQTIIKPFKVFGTNAITAYVLSGIVAVLFDSIEIGQESIQSYSYSGLLHIFVNPYLSSLVYAILFTKIIYIPILMLYSKKVFIKI